MPRPEELIRERLIALISRHAEVSPDSISQGSPIWQRFPVSTTYREHPAVTSFVHDVQSEFGVYLTEEEWQDPTPNSLAERIYAKSENPTVSRADWTRDENEMRRGARMAFVVLNVMLGIASLLAARGSPASQIFVVAGVLLLVNLTLLLIYRAAIKKLNAAAPRTPSL
jgi:hypothetical protein